MCAHTHTHTHPPQDPACWNPMNQGVADPLPEAPAPLGWFLRRMQFLQRRQQREGDHGRDLQKWPSRGGLLCVLGLPAIQVWCVSPPPRPNRQHPGRQVWVPGWQDVLGGRWASSSAARCWPLSQPLAPALSVANSCSSQASPPFCSFWSRQPHLSSSITSPARPQVSRVCTE